MKSLLVPLATILLSLSVLPAHAQPPTLVLNHLVATEDTDQVALHLYFTPVEASGRPFLEQLDESGSIQLLGEGSAPTPATIQKPNEPIYITFLLDASGSMAPLMDQVQTAAISALEHAPGNAHFAVIQFNDVAPSAELRLPRDFTTDRNLIAKDIRDVQAGTNAPTCLYNATDKAIELLRKRMQPQERGAVILFTDGRDQLQDPTKPCSNRTIDDVTYSAVGVEGIDIPVHTIGLCTDGGCGNLDRAALTTLAKETNGFSAIGNETNLDNMFQQIMEGLNSQWLATATVFPRKGKNDAVLKVRTGGQTPLEFTTTFFFNSTIDTIRPAPPAVAKVDNFHDLDATTYEFAVSVNSPDPASIKQVIVQTYNEQHIRVDEQVLTPSGQVSTATGLSWLLQLDTTSFADGEHTIQVQAVDRQHNFILNPDDESVLAEWEFTYKAPPSIQAPTFTIRTVDAVRNTNGQAELVININVPADQGVDLIYEGFIRAKDGGGSAGILERDLLKGTQIVVPLPAAMRNKPTSIEYTLNLTLRRGNEGVGAEETFDFAVQPAGQRSRMEQFSDWLKTNALWLLFIFSLLLALLLWRIIQKRRQARRDAEIVRPERSPLTDAANTSEQPLLPRRKTTVATGPTKSIAPRLLVQSVHNGSKAESLEQELSHFPCVFGRNEKLAHGRVTPLDKRFYLNLLGDEKISRRHLEIKLQGGQFYVTDLESTNKTKLNGQPLEAKTPVVLNGLSQLQLGPNTKLEIQPFV